MSLRRRLVLLFGAYCVIIGIGGALVVWISAERDQEVDRQTSLIEQATVDSFDRAALIRSQDRLDDLRMQLTFTMIVVLAVALVMTVVAGLLVRRWVTRPIERVSSAVRGARAGEVGVIAPQGPPEIAGLARDVDSMRVDMNRALFDAVRAREVIEQSASVVFTMRSELGAEVGELPGEWSLAAELQPAEGVVAGDCYDVITITPTVLGLIIVDISGHGSVSGIVALRCRELLRATLRNGLEPGDAIQWGADQLDDLGDETFLSTFVAVVDLANGDVRYASAGHPPPILCVGNRATELAPTGPIVGPLPGPWSTQTTTVGPGDTLAIYTDGLIEARSADREEFGVERLAELVCAATCDEAFAIAKQCIDEVTAFSPERTADDVTIVLLCRGPRATRASVAP